MANSPLYRTIYESLRQDIMSGKLPHDMFLPSEKDLCDTWHTSRITIRAALKQLEEEGIVIALPKRGRRVNFPLGSTHSTGKGTVLLMGRQAPGEGVVYEACSDVLRQDGYTCEFLPVTQQEDDKGECLVDAYERDKEKFAKAKGLIFFSGTHWNAFEKIAATLPIPVVCLGYNDESPVEVICSDNIQDGSQLVSHLYELGHRRIAYFDWARLEVNPSIMMNRYGYEWGMRKLGLEPWTVGLSSDDYPLSPDMPEKCRHWFALDDAKKRPTAVICSFSYLCIEYTRLLNGLGISVPDDMSVCTFGESSEAKEKGFSFETFTSMSMDWEGVSRMGGQRMLMRLQHATSRVSRTLVPARLVIGGSSHPLNA